MQQTETLSNNTPVTLSPSFQDWLDNEKTAARRHRISVLKITAFFVAALLILLIQGQGPVIQDLLSQVLLTAQP